MFERYSECARRVVFFARYEASQFGSLHIESPHLLLGLLREEPAIAALAGQSVDELRSQVESQVPRAAEKRSTSVDLPLSHESKRVLAYAAEEAERLGHRNIDCLHLTLGLLREEDSQAARLLAGMGVTRECVRERLETARRKPPDLGEAVWPLHEAFSAEWAPGTNAERRLVVGYLIELTIAYYAHWRSGAPGTVLLPSPEGTARMSFQTLPWPSLVQIWGNLQMMILLLMTVSPPPKDEVDAYTHLVLEQLAKLQ